MKHIRYLLIFKLININFKSLILGNGEYMSDTLDRLKALNSKLEEKLTATDEPNTKVSRPKPTDTTVEEEEIIDSGIDDSIECAKIAQSIIDQMDIDEKQDETRAANIHRVAQLYKKLQIDEKAPDFDQIFIYKAMNISGIGLKEDDFGEIREGKYTQIIAITYEPDKNGKKKAKNISLSYFGKAEKLDDTLKSDIMEFVLRWRYEKAFQNLGHYKDLLAKIKPADTLF